MFRLACTVAVLFVVTEIVAGQSNTDRIVGCGHLQQDACHIVKACTFCRSKWGESMCFAEEQVDRLPAGVLPLSLTARALGAKRLQELRGPLRMRCTMQLNTGSPLVCSKHSVRL